MIYMAIPLAAIGGVFALWMREMPFSISAGVGFIVLFGVAVLNGLVLINRFNSLKEEGVTNLKDRILTGTKERIRPIMLTATTDIFGFLPMAFSVSAGGEVQRPLATVVIGGMLSATLLTLVVLPVLYTFVEKRREKKNRNNGHKTALNVIVLLIGLGGIAGFSQSANAQGINADTLQTISIEEAQNRAVTNFPQIKAKRLQIKSEEALKKTAYDLGKTQFFTGSEEFGMGSSGVYTIIGAQQQNIDVFGIAPKKALQKQRVFFAETALDLSETILRQKVREAYYSTYIARNKWLLYRRLDSIYQDFQRAAQVKYEVQETSRLAFLAASNQVKQITLQLEQSAYDYATELQKLNLWLVTDTIYTVTETLPPDWLEVLHLVDSLSSHPLLAVANQRILVAEAELKVAKASLKPRFNAQYGLQRIVGQFPFHQFQVGVSIPLFAQPEKARIQAAKIQTLIAEQNYQQDYLELNAEYRALWQQYRKWYASWQFYQQEALPLSREQLQGSILAYREGAIEYVTFIQNLQTSVQTEVNAQETLGRYLDVKAKLEYYFDLSN